MEDFERELKEDFLEESIQLLEDTEQSFLALENDKDSADLLDQIFRLAHNLKGTSRAVGFGEVAEFTHEMENLILKLKTGEIEVTDYVVTVLLECNDHITHMINTLRDDLEATFESQEVISHILAVLDGNIHGEGADAPAAEVEEAPAAEEFEAVPSSEAFAEEETVDVAAVSESEEWEGLEDELDSILDEAIEEIPAAHDAQDQAETLLAEAPASAEDGDTEISAAALESLKELGIDDPSLVASLDVKTADKPAVDEGMTIKKGEEVIAKVEPIKQEASKPAEPKPESKPAASSAPKKKNEDESIRVSLSRVENLNNVVGELVILQTVLEQRRHLHIQDSLANKSISQLGKLSKEIQEISMSLRMVPIKSTLQKMNRIVRDTSKTLDKKVNLTLMGEDTEIDKTVLEHLSDPLVHIVRNAVDHGLESTEDRIKAGKSEVGEVGIRAMHEGNNLVIEITDDGGGIPADVIRRKAIEKKLIREDQKISDHEMIQYIFHPGFSTKEQVTEVSGRGVGMDVVKTNIERLSGDVQVSTQLGKGSVFRIVLPLTMAIIEGMVIRVGSEKYIIPLAQVHESLKPSQDIVHQVTGMGECLNLRGEVLPLFNIGKTLSRKMDDGPSHNKIAIIVHHNKFNFAVLVDDILHQQQVVIKKLGDEIKNQRGFMGSSILGDGRPSFILDLNELYAASMKEHKNSINNKILGKVA